MLVERDSFAFYIPIWIGPILSFTADRRVEPRGPPFASSSGGGATISIPFSLHEGRITLRLSDAPSDLDPPTASYEFDGRDDLYLEDDTVRFHFRRRHAEREISSEDGE